MSTILIVDDDQVNRQLLSTLLRYEGHVTVEAADGAQALDAVRTHRPALVISDLVMPTMDGYEFVRQMRDDRTVGATPVIFYTANYFEREARGLATACGVLHVLTKPTEPERILATVREALDGTDHSAHRQLDDTRNFDLEHVRLMTDKLSAKVSELEATRLRLMAVVDVIQQLARERDAVALFQRFTMSARKVIAAKRVTIALADDLVPASDAVPRPFELAVSLASATTNYGTVTFHDNLGGSFTDEDTAIAASLVASLAVAYENILRLQSLERHAAVLEERVAARTVELQRSNEDLEQFAYVASHDLQEPLRMVASFTQLLAKRYRGRLDPDADEFIGYVVEGATRMQALIHDLLAYSRIGASATTTTAAIDADVDRAIDSLSVAIAESGAAITRDPLPAIASDHRQLTQLFQNLIGNAIKFRSDRPPAIHIGAVSDQQEWRFFVRDNGIGIDPQFANRIFVIFSRLHSRADYPGTGIGLAICKRIVSRLGGRIWVDSATGSGATFWFTVPHPRHSEAE
jgi:signal transduction histidine kinase